MNKDLITVEPNPKNLEGLKILIEQWATDRNLHMVNPVTQRITVCNTGRLACGSDTNL